MDEKKLQILLFHVHDHSSWWLFPSPHRWGQNHRWVIAWENCSPFSSINSMHLKPFLQDSLKFRVVFLLPFHSVLPSSFLNFAFISWHPDLSLMYYVKQQIFLDLNHVFSQLQADWPMKANQRSKNICMASASWNLVLKREHYWFLLSSGNKLQKQLPLCDLYLKISLSY